MYIPELVFGHLLTGSNFNDAQSRFTGGRHGFGAKLTNIFSKEFEVETYDRSRGLLYRQRWTDNMSVRHEPRIETLDPAKAPAGDYTVVRFTPDLEREPAVAVPWRSS